MCIGKPECQHCRTCGLRKYQLWVGPEMHDAGCPFGHATAGACPDVQNAAKMGIWMLEMWEAGEFTPSKNSDALMCLAQLPALNAAASAKARAYLSTPITSHPGQEGDNHG